MIEKLLTLSPEKNEIQVTAFNQTNQITSIPAVLHLTCQDEISKKPSLYIVAVGINKYRDGALRLKYSVPDAISICRAFEKQSRTIFGAVNVERIFDKNVTMKGIQAVFDRITPRIKTQDVFVFYVAGHGVTQEGRYHLIPHDFRYRNETSVLESGINQDHIQAWLASVPARKSLVLLDTCDSGSFTKSKKGSGLL